MPGLKLNINSYDKLSSSHKYIGWWLQLKIEVMNLHNVLHTLIFTAQIQPLIDLKCFELDAACG